MNEFLTPQKVTAILQAYNLRPAKRFGQNYLIDRNILNKMIKAVDISSEDIVLEVGPGLGALTSELSSRAKFVYSVEADPGLIPYLTDSFKNVPDLEFIFGDAMNIALLSGVRKHNRIKLIANLPYNIATALIQKYLRDVPEITDFYFLVQKEVAERMTSHEGNKCYGYYSVLIRSFGQAKILFDVKPGSFFPPPRVLSSFVQIKRYDKPIFGREAGKRFLKIVEAAFGSRRKKAVNSLSMNLDLTKDEVAQAIIKCGLSENVRAEGIPFETFVKLGEEMLKLSKKE